MNRGKIVYGNDIDFSVFNRTQKELEQFESIIEQIESFLDKPINNEKLSIDSF